MSVYRGMDQAALDAAYNNSAAVANSAEILADWHKRSDELAAARPEHLDLRYGPRERNRIDYFSSGRAGAPVLAFIHGGYWQMRAKETFRFIASGPLAHGIDVALIAYTLAPDASLREIVDEVKSGITWVADNAPRFGGDPERIYVSGWSAGAHLTATSLDHPAMRGGLAVSGLYDLEPIRLSYVNEKLKLDADDVYPLSPQLDLVRSPVPLFIAYGTAELSELKRQSRDFAAARAHAGLPGQLFPSPGHNHFTILEELASPVGALTALVRELVAA
jgi:arylformamidase